MTCNQVILLLSFYRGLREDDTAICGTFDEDIKTLLKRGYITKNLTFEITGSGVKVVKAILTLL